MVMKVSNNSLAVLLAVAIVASVSATWFSVSFMDTITGAATSDTGTTTLTVDAETSCLTIDGTVALGNLGKNISNSSEVVGDYIEVENNGNVNIDILGYASAELWDDVSYQAPSSYWQIKCNRSQSGTCNESYLNLNESQGTGYIFISGLVFADSTDNVTVGVNVTVPPDESTGAKSGTITFFCSAS
jgi:hypothetical protein